MANCQSCNKHFIPGKNARGKFCNQQCQADLRSWTVVDAWLKNQCAETFYSSNQTRPGIRRYLIKKSNCKCSRCGWGETHRSAVLPALEIEHIDGNWLNCTESNIDIICPNCHSLTDTYKARNKGKGRNYRRAKQQGVEQVLTDQD